MPGWLRIMTGRCDVLVFSFQGWPWSLLQPQVPSMDLRYDFNFLNNNLDRWLMPQTQLLKYDIFWHCWLECWSGRTQIYSVFPLFVKNFLHRNDDSCYVFYIHSFLFFCFSSFNYHCTSCHYKKKKPILFLSTRGKITSYSSVLILHVFVELTVISAHPKGKKRKKRHRPWLPNAHLLSLF